MTAQDSLFQKFPLRGTVDLSTGTVQTPYHVYDGYGLFIGGTANLAQVQALMTDEQLVPVQTEDNRALIGLWLMDFTQPHLQPHTEFQCSVFVQEQAIAPLEAHPFTILRHMVTAPDPAILCADIWNNTAECVAYNHEHLGLSAKLCDSSFTRSQDGLRFAFNDNNGLLIEGDFKIPPRTGFGDNMTMLRFFGFGTIMEFVRSEYVTLDVINRRSDVIPQNRRAHSYTKNSKSVVRRFDPAADTLTFGNIPFANIDFTPDFVQVVEGIKFVYLDPR